MDERRLRAAMLVAMVVVAAVLQTQLWGWEVEDAALDFGFARHLADGDGLVAQVGRERIEGFSNPAWVALLALANLVGIDPFVASRLLGLGLGLAAIPVVYLAVRPIAKDPPYGAHAAAATIALFAPHVIWSQSGLENPLFSLLLALGLAWAPRAGNRDWLGPILFLLLACTRPEGAVYAVAAALVNAASARGPYGARSRILRWGLVLGAGLVASESARLWYFAQELPTTYYARMGAVVANSSAAWDQLAGLGRDTGLAALVPLAIFGAGGTATWRGPTAAVASLLFLLAAALGWTMVAVGVVCVALPVLTEWRRPPLGMAVGMLLVGLAFHIGSGGDWMRGYRYLSLIAVPGAMLVGVGVGELADRIDELRHGPLVALGAALLPQVLFVANYARHPEAAPSDDRLQSTLALAKRLQIERRPRVADHDLGGLLWAGEDELWIRDTRGLVDVPFALWGADRAVVEHELLRDPAIDFAHFRATTEAALADQPQFRDGYVSAGPDGDQYVRRNLFLAPGWEGPPMRARFANGVEIVGLKVPSPEVAASTGLYVEIGMTRGSGAPFRAVLFLVDVSYNSGSPDTEGGLVRASWELPPAHDWVAPADWRPEEVFHGRFALPLPAETRRGVYGLGLVLLGPDGAVVPAADAGAPAKIPRKPAYARGELRIPGALRVVGDDELTTLAQADRSDAMRLAGGARCEEAEDAWLLAVHRETRSTDWRAQNQPVVAGALARCWANRAARGTMEGDALVERVREIERAREWDPREPAVWGVGEQLAVEAHARATGSDLLPVRFLWAEAAVRADPRRSWDRRLVERSRPTAAREGAVEGTPN